MLTLITGRIVHPHGPDRAQPLDGTALFTLDAQGVIDGGIYGRDSLSVPVVGGELVGPVALAPGLWDLTVTPADCAARDLHLQLAVEPGVELIDLASVAPVAVIDGIAYTRGPAGRGIDSLGNADAEGWATVVWTDGTTSQMRVPTVTLTAEERAVLDGVLAQAREAEQDARRAESAAGTAMGHASAAADARDAARAARDAAQAEHQAVRDALAAGELTGEDGHSPEVTMTGDQVTVDGEIVGPHLTGPAPSVEWTGTRLTVGGQTGPDLKGAPGAPGKDSTVPGPPNVLSIGTVTTGAPGSQAVAQIKGTAPSQSLDLTIPTGKDATPPAFTASATALAATAQPTASISGTYPNLALALGIPAGGGGGGGGTITAAGRPDIPSTLTVDLRAQVAAAPSGTTFTSTDGAGVGAWAWRLHGTKWDVIDGDTGERRITAASGVTSGAVYVRRTQAACFVALRGGSYDALSISASRSGRYVYILNSGAVPMGWRVSSTQYALATNDGEGLLGVVLLSNADFLILSGLPDAIAYQYLRCQGLVYSSRDPWPTSLPGTAA